MLIQLSFSNSEHLWLRVLSVNYDREAVVGRVWNHPFNRGLMLGQKIQSPIDDIYIYDIQYKDLNVISY